MQKEPEIVKILRKEEQLRNLQMKSSGICENVQIPEDASIDALLVVSKDIVENKKAEQLLVENEKKYRTIFEFFPQTILLVDKNGIILDVNEQIREWLGYKPNEILEVNLFSVPFFTKKSKKIIKKNFSNRLLNKTIPAFEIEVLTKSGEKRMGVVYTTSLRNEQKEIIADFMVISDITELKHKEEAMRIKDRAITSSINAIILADLKGNITYVNKSFLRIWGYAKDKDVLGKPMVQFWKMKGKYIEVMDVLIITGEWVGELTGIRKDHSTFQVQLSANMIRDKSTKPICIMGCFVDITKYKKTVKAPSETDRKFNSS
jgi:PAS domain S-box-containing protein